MASSRPLRTSQLIASRVGLGEASGSRCQYGAAQHTPYTRQCSLHGTGAGPGEHNSPGWQSFLQQNACARIISALLPAPVNAWDRLQRPASASFSKAAGRLGRAPSAFSPPGCACTLCPWSGLTIAMAIVNSSLRPDDPILYSVRSNVLYCTIPRLILPCCRTSPR